jgi:hypothetical protein
VLIRVEGDEARSEEREREESVAVCSFSSILDSVPLS